MSDEAEAIRDRISALVDAAHGSWFFGGGWDPGVLSVAAVCGAVGIPVPGPPDISMTDAELAELRAMLADARPRPVVEEPNP